MVMPASRRGLTGAALLILLLCVIPGFAQEKTTGGVLRGTVYDKDFGVPLPRVRVTVVETGFFTFTNQDGVFLIEGLAPGTYTLTLTKEGYERSLATGISVTIGRLTDIRQDLSPEILELDEMVVTGVDFLENSEIGLLEIRAVAVAVQDAVSADFIRQAGVSDVAGALKLVTGASVVEGKYATVRGLSDRYTGVTLNGVRVPSADPRKRAAQIDLFPTGTIESITVTKTFSPDLQGDFTGGGVDIKTKSIPEEASFSISTSIESNSLATNNRDFLTYRGGGVERTGLQSGNRDLPDFVRQEFPKLPVFNPRFITPADIEAAAFFDKAAHSFSPIMGAQRSGPEYNHGFSISGGNTYKWGKGRKLGLVGAFTYSHKYDAYEGGENNSGGVSTSDGIVVLDERSDEKGIDKVQWGLMGSIGYQPNDRHELSVKLIANHSATDETRLQVQRLGPESVEQNQSLNYTERSVVSLQFQGTNQFPHALARGDKSWFQRAELSWSVSGNYSRQDEPDVRFFRNLYNYITHAFTTPANTNDAYNTRRTWRKIEERNGQAALNLLLPFQGWGAEGSIKSGGFLEQSKRDYTQTSFSYHFASQFGPNSNEAVRNNRALATYISDAYRALWTDVFASPSRTGSARNRCVVAGPPCTSSSTQLLWYIDPVGNDLNYTGEQDILAYYGMVEFPLRARLKLVGGMRLENTRLSIVPVNVVTGTVEIIETDEFLNRRIITVPQEQGKADIDRTHRLPALGVIWDIRDKMKLRLNYAKTLARPTFRELAPVAAEEFLFGDEFLGNPQLRPSDISNLDARWEWLPQGGDVLAFSMFTKQITDPIEYISFGASNRRFVQPTNYGKGRVKGAEIEARAGLERFWKRLAGFEAGFNATWIDSEVDVPFAEQKSLRDFGLNQPTRRLQGQPEYIANAHLTYDNEKSGTSLGIFFNAIGDTLVSGAARGTEDGIPDLFEKAFTSLDLTFSQQWGKHLTLSIKSGNLLPGKRISVYRVPKGVETTKSNRPTPRTVAAGLSYKW